MTSIVIRIIALHFFRPLCMTACIPLSTAWWMWSCSVSLFHLPKQTRWTLEFSWSNKHGYKCQKALKGFETYKQSFSDRKKLQQKKYYPESIFGHSNHHLKPSKPVVLKRVPLGSLRVEFLISGRKFVPGRDWGKKSCGWKKLSFCYLFIQHIEFVCKFVSCNGF